MNKLPPWRSPLDQALHRNRSLPHLNFVQLATVDPQGHPHNRTVVYRGLINHSNDLKFISDFRSKKIAQIQHQPWVEICWYFTKTREQLRFSGIMDMISNHTLKSPTELMSADQELWISTWTSLSANTQSQFYWPTPGETRSQKSTFLTSEPTPLPPLPPDNFVLLRLQVKEVEHLQLQGNPQERDRYFQTIDQKWCIQSVNP